MVRAKLGAEPYKVEIATAGHALVADESHAHGGANAGPSPFDLVLAGLAACTLITLRMYAERKGWADFAASAQMSVSEEGEGGRRRIDRKVTVSGAPDAAGLERLRDIVERTPVTRTLKAGFDMTTDLAEGAMQ